MTRSARKLRMDRQCLAALAGMTSPERLMLAALAVVMVRMTGASVAEIEDVGSVDLLRQDLVAVALTLPSGERLSARAGGIGFTAMIDPALHLQISSDQANCVESWIDRLEVLIDSWALNPSLPAASLSLLTRSEYEHLIEFENRTEAQISEIPIHELIEIVADARPNAHAVVMHGYHLTYAELERRANRIAHRLMARGVRPGKWVLVGLEPSPDAIVAILGVLKAGGAYVPLDPAYPQQRLQAMIDDHRDSPLVTSRDLVPRFPPGYGPVLFPDQEGEGPDHRPSASGGIDHLAYAIYTSGSSGRPKGTAVDHRALVNVITASARDFGIGPKDRVFQFSSLSFDVSVWEIFATLTAGACLVIADRETKLSEHQMAELIQAEGVTTIFLLASLLANLNPSNFAMVSTVVTGGELFSDELVRAWGFNRRLFYVYGPTEATIFQSYIECSPNWAPTPTIGRPMQNMRYYLVDQQMMPVPIGVAGELCIAGIGVGHGYVGLPELTGEKFLEDPFVRNLSGPARRMYRSGDRAVRRPDGNLDFLGRIDDQIKIRGYRVEIGEIEAALAANPGVKHAAVVARATPSGDLELVAHLVPVETQSLDKEGLRQFLAALLPDYMIPSRFVPEVMLPRSPNGKIDRGALRSKPLPDRLMPATPAANQLEHVLLQIWREIFLTEDIGVDDKFIDLGGHSLKAMAVVARIRHRLGRTVEVRQIFLHPTIAELASEVERNSEQERAPIAHVPDADDYPISHAQRGLWLFDQATGPTAIYNVPVRYIIDGAIDPGRWAAAFKGLIGRHESLRTIFTMRGGEPRQRTLSNGPGFVMNIVDIDPDQVDLILDERAHQAFDLARGPLIRAAILRLTPDRALLAIELHHIICDAWSITLLIRDLTALYRGAALEPLPAQARDFAVWQDRSLRHGDLNLAREYWHGKLRDQAPFLDLPIDYPRVRQTSGTGALEHFVINAQDRDALLRLARESGCSLFVVLVAFVKLLLHRYTGSADISVGTPIAGRSRLELEPQIGMYVSTVVLRDQLDPQDTFPRFLNNVFVTAMAALTHEEYPFDLLVDELEPPRAPARHPFFDVWVALHEARDRRIPVEPGLALALYERDFRTRLFDLSFQFEDVDGTLLGTLQYDSDLYDRDTIRLMVRRFFASMREGLMCPTAALADIAFAEPVDAKLPTRKAGLEDFAFD